MRFEYWGFQSDCFTRYHNEKANDLGINGYNVVTQKLQDHNYTLERVWDEDGGDVVATLME